MAGIYENKFEFGLLFPQVKDVFASHAIQINTMWVLNNS